MSNDTSAELHPSPRAGGGGGGAGGFPHPFLDVCLGMDLKEQLVIWKKAGYLLDNVALTPKLTARLVDEGIFTLEMMQKIMRKQYNTERILMLLSMLGTHGGDKVYERFLKALDTSDHHKVVRELQKTEKFTYFGDARKLKKIADEKDQEKDLHTLIIEQQQRELEEKQQREEEGGKKKKKKRRRAGNSLSDDKLRYLADQIGHEWRHLGQCLDLTNNNLDMVEADCETKPEPPGFAMLKVWRDNEKGKTLQLLVVLLELNKEKLAMAMAPNNRMVQLAKVQKKKREEKDSQTEEDEMLDAWVERLLDNEEPGDKTEDENVKSSIPTLPPIGNAEK